jgi:gas vesicle protein
MADLKKKLSRKERKRLKKLEKKKKKGVVDKVVMGTIVGGAIGSVVGLTLAPQKGKETRKYIKAKGKKAYDRGKEMGDKFMEDHGNEIQAAKKKTKKKSAKAWKFIKKKLLKRS